MESIKKTQKISLPKFLNKYFWDVDFRKLDAGEYPYFIIERILEYGDEQAVKWMMANFENTKIKETLMRSRGISLKSANYWALIFNVPKNKILCLKKSYRKVKESHWPYWARVKS